MPSYTIDRFEGSEWAALEDETARTFQIPRTWLPADAREGDVVNASTEQGRPISTVRLELDSAARERQEARVRDLRERLPRGPKGDVSL
jgi:DUF3006 family protein